jgi:hypothetical protein
MPATSDCESCWWISCGISGAISLILFFGLFFGLNYPEIKQHQWPAAKCTVIWERLDENYKCGTSCSYCGSTSSSLAGGKIVSTGNSYSPVTCRNDSSKCPPVGQHCNNGYKCCSECCSMYSTSCTEDCDSKGRCTEDCSTYCSLYVCCQSTSSLDCTLTCPIHATVTLGVTFYASKKFINSSIVTDCGTDLPGANRFYTKYGVDTIFTCHYDPNNPMNVIIDPKYTTWKWVLSAFPMVVLLSFIIFVVVMMCRCMCKYKWEHKVTSDNSPNYTL